MNIVPRGAERKVVPTPPEAVSVLDGPPTSSAHEMNEPHPLEARVTGWRSTQDALRMELLRQTEGPAEPIRRAMESYIIDQTTFVPAVMGGPSTLAHDVLRGTEDYIEWEDVYRDEPTLSFHQELEQRMFKR